MDLSVEVVPHAEGFHFGRVGIDELIVDVFVHVDAGAGVAGLSKIHVDTLSRPSDSSLDIASGKTMFCNLPC